MTEQSISSKGSDHVEALARGLRVLEVFDRADRALTLSELAKHVGLARATARRTLHTLSALGYVEQDGKVFRLTPDVLRLAAAYLTSNGLTTVLQQACDTVTAELAQACSAAVLRGTDVVFIARARPEAILSVGLEIGYRLPAVSTSVGRAILSKLDGSARDAIVSEARPEPVTEATLTDPELIRAAILTAGSQGYALVDQEAEAGFRSIAVPVLRHDGHPVAALNVGAPAERVSIGRMIDDFRPALEKAAAHAGGLIV